MCDQIPDDFGYYVKWLSRSDVRRSIHVGSLPYNDGSKVEHYLTADLMKSIKPQLTETMNYYKVPALFLLAPINSVWLHMSCDLVRSNCLSTSMQ